MTAEQHNSTRAPRCEWCDEDQLAEVRVTDYRKMSVSMCRDCYHMTWDSDMVRWNGGNPTVQDLDNTEQTR